MRGLPVFRHNTSCSRWPTSKAAHGRPRSRNEAPAQLMIKTAKAITDAEIEPAADYFSGLTPRATIKVVEAAAVPKTRVAGWFLAALPGGETEPIAGRIIEVPEDLERFELRDARSHFIAYVPPGSVEQGRQLATTGGNGKSAPCTPTRQWICAS